jgi:UDPglucose 6-dehydrogenase
VAFLREVDGINKRRRARTVDLVRELAGGELAGARVTALGAAFKPNSDDIRDAPALDVARTLHRSGAHVTVVDPAATENARRAYPELEYGTDALAAATGADVVVLLTEWAEFRQIDPEAMGAVVAQRRIVDGRHALVPEQWRSAGWEYRALGRP